MSLEPHGLLTPFRRDRKQDLAHGDGNDLVDAHVQQVLGTEPGELLWRTAFGTPLERLRHQRNDLVLAELGRVYVRDALRRWCSAQRLSVALSVDAERVRIAVLTGPYARVELQSGRAEFPDLRRVSLLERSDRR